MDNMELNKKLAEWAGWKQVINYNDPSLNEEHPPNFTNSLDAIFKWLVPLAIDKIMSDQECSSDLAYAILFKKWLQELELDIPYHAPTLCLAIEKLIEEEKC